jgi:psiF repeat-containing protein
VKGLIALLCCALLTGPVLAQDKKKEPSEKQKAQQERMKDCNAKMGDKKGDERKKAMSSCLKGENAGASDKQKAQQDKMKDCNKQAEGKKGDERKKFMSGCLKG